MHLRLTTALVSAVATVALGLTAACSSGGGSNDTAACNNILREIQNVGTQASGQTSNPAAVGKIYSDAAVNIRTASNGASDKVKKAASNLATSLDTLGSSLSNLNATNPEVPDTTTLLDAGSAMQTACR